MFKKAEKKQSKLRLLIGSPSGGGKTMSSLLIATGLSEKICMVDTERGSASLYADQINFDVSEMENYSVSEFVKNLDFAEKAGYEVFILDSTTHIWDEILEDNQRIMKAKPYLNSYTVWADGNSKYKKFIQAILNSAMHIICTVRMKTEYVMQDNGKGKQAPVKVGMGMEQRGGFEYEFTAVMEGTVENVFTVTKDRTGLMQGRIFDKPGRDLGVELKAWLQTGAEPKPKEIILTQQNEQQPPQKTAKQIRDEKILALPEIAEQNGITDIADFAVFAGMNKDNPERKTAIDVFISEPSIYLDTIRRYKETNELQITDESNENIPF